MLSIPLSQLSQLLQPSQLSQILQPSQLSNITTVTGEIVLAIEIIAMVTKLDNLTAVMIVTVAMVETHVLFYI